MPVDIQEGLKLMRRVAEFRPPCRPTQHDADEDEGDGDGGNDGDGDD